MCACVRVSDHCHAAHTHTNTHIHTHRRNSTRFGKGVVFVRNVNGVFNVGRYWQRGPQYALYVPRDFLAPLNDVIVLELDEDIPFGTSVSFRDTPRFE
jgi:hypothetical protein